MLRNNSNPSKNRHNVNHSMSAVRVKNFMQSIDPSRVGKNCIPSSPHDSIPSTMTLPLFPDPESFGMEPPVRTPPSLPKRKKKQNLFNSPFSSISSVSSAISSPPHSSNRFYSSNHLRVKTNPIKVVPYPRKTLFLSPTRAMTDSVASKFTTPTSSCKSREQNSNEALLLNPIHRNNFQPGVVPLLNDNSSRVNVNMQQTIGITNTASRYGNQCTSSDQLFGVTIPEIKRKSSPFLFETPRTPESKMAGKLRNPLVPPTPVKQLVPFTSTTTGTRTPTAIVTNPWHSSGITTPKRVSLDTATNENSGKFATNKLSSPHLTIKFPMLRPQPSVGTAAAASALVSLMETPVLGKRILSGTSSLSPHKKRKMAPTRISSNAKKNSSRPNALEEEGENCHSLSNRSDHSSSSQEPTKKEVCREKNPKNSSKPITCQTLSKEVEQSLSQSESVIDPTAYSGVVKRIPRRFIDDPSLPVLKSGMRLAAPNDYNELNSLHCFVRSDLLEVFVLEDLALLNYGNNRKQMHRVGIRCVHCGTKPKCERVGTSMSTFFPKSVQDIYRGVCTWQRIHFSKCKHIPKNLKNLYKALKDGDRTRGKKAHWVKSAEQMGFRNVDEHRNGVVWIESAVAREEESDPQRPAVALDLTLSDDGDSGSGSIGDNIIVHV